MSKSVIPKKKQDDFDLLKEELQALRRDSETISLDEVQQGIRREYVKERKGG